MTFNFLKITFLVAIVGLLSLQAQAQRGEMTPEKFEAHITRMTEGLELTKKQTKKIRKIEETYFAETEAVRAERVTMMRNKDTAKKQAKTTDKATEKGNEAPQAAERNKMRREKMRMINNKHNNSLKAVLTAEQFEKYKSAKTKRNDRMRDRVRAAKGKSKAAKESMQKGQ
ncbi:MAG: hypothetical protein AAF738_00560 [Bacteroidota bacterium]